MDRKELDIILKEGEGYKIEFKEGIGNLGKELIAFANSSNENYFYITFKQSREYLRIIEREEVKEEIAIVLNERQKKAVEYVKARRSISISEYISLNNVSDNTTRRDLTGLVAKGIFRREGVTTGLKFKLTSVNFG